MSERQRARHFYQVMVLCSKSSSQPPCGVSALEENGEVKGGGEGDEGRVVMQETQIEKVHGSMKEGMTL